MDPQHWGVGNQKGMVGERGSREERMNGWHVPGRMWELSGAAWPLTKYVSRLGYIMSLKIVVRKCNKSLFTHLEVDDVA
jgi:hypothetical protein